MKKFRIVKNQADEFSAQERVCGIWCWVLTDSDGYPFCYPTKEGAQGLIDRKLRELEIVNSRKQRNIWTPI